MRKSRDTSGDDQPEKRKKSSQETSESASDDEPEKRKKESKESELYVSSN